MSTWSRVIRSRATSPARSGLDWLSRDQISTGWARSPISRPSLNAPLAPSMTKLSASPKANSGPLGGIDVAEPTGWRRPGRTRCRSRPARPRRRWAASRTNRRRSRLPSTSGRRKSAPLPGVLEQTSELAHPGPPRRLDDRGHGQRGRPVSLGSARPSSARLAGVPSRRPSPNPAIRRRRGRRPAPGQAGVAAGRDEMDGVGEHDRMQLGVGQTAERRHSRGRAGGGC